MNRSVRASGIHVRTDNLLLFLGEPGIASIDLSKATKLKEVVFGLDSWSVKWITTALQTITPEHQDIRQILIHIPYHLFFYTSIGQVTRMASSEGWLDLDRLLVQSWESRSIQPTAICATRREAEYNTRFCVTHLLPEITRRGMIVIDLVGR